MTDRKLQPITPVPSGMTLQERIDNYHRETGFPTSMWIGGDGRISANWVMGQRYTVKSKFHGGYPHGYLHRMKALFPDKKAVLHLFAGEVDTSIIMGTTVDLNPDRKPDIVDNAETLERVPLHLYDIIYADPPYSGEDADHYGVPMVNRNTVIRVLQARMRPGAHLVWLDQVWPMFRKAELQVEGFIGMTKSTNHRFRQAVIFAKL